MDTVTINKSSLGRIGPYHVVVPILAVILAFYAKQFLPPGALGITIGALTGALWAVGLGFIAQRLARREESRAWLANGAVFLGVIILGLTIGGGWMYASMMKAVLNASSLTYAVLQALMQPAVPFYIILNTTMELFIVSLIVFWNWDTHPNRRMLVLIGVLAYCAMRIWTYLVFAETRLEISQHTLSQADVEWFKQTLATDFRLVLNTITYVCFLIAAFLPVRADRNGEASRINLTAR